MGETRLVARLPELSADDDADALFRLGLRFVTAPRAARDDAVTAHALFELAARLGSLEAKIYRRELGNEMDPEDLAEARGVVREWLARR